MANKRLAKKKAKMEAAKQVKAEKTVVEAVVVEEAAKVEEVVEVAPVEEVAPVVEETKVEEPVVEAVVEEVKAEEAVEEKPAKKRTRKTAVKVSLVLQAGGKELTETEAYEKAIEDWCKSGFDRADVKEIAVYVKPEESAIYYVINGKATGRVSF